MAQNHNETLLLTGLGDDRTVDRQTRFVTWQNKRRPVNAQIQVFDTRWQTAEEYDAKRNRLTKFVNEHAGIKTVYAISAGASLGMSLVPELPSDTVYSFISGKLLHTDNIGAERNKRAPALNDAVSASEEVIKSHDLSLYNITCYAGYVDGVLDQQDMRIPGVPFERIHMLNHSATIALAYLTVLRRT